MSHVPFYLQIEEEILALVRSGGLAEYARVPSEHQLAARFRVSRMTARKALDRLVAAGVLFRQPGKGTFVASAKISHRASTQLSFSAAIAELGLRLETKVLEATVISAPPNAAAALTERRAAPVVFIKRLRIIEGQPAAIHSAYLPVRFERILTEDLTGSLTELTARIVAPLVRSLDAIEAIAAGSEDADVLGLAVGTPLVRHEGIGFSAASEPLRYTEGLYRSDRFRFSIDTATRADLRPQLKVVKGQR